MSDLLDAQEARIDDDYPFAIDLELRIEDRDVIEALTKYPEGPEREGYAVEALKIGVLALRRASSAIDGEFFQRETNRLLEALSQNLDQHAAQANDRLSRSLNDYFDPQSGRFAQRVQRLVADDGELAVLLRGSIDGEDSRLARTLAAHVGQNSPLMKHLSPEQSEGLLALLKATVETQLAQQRDRLMKEFSLDNNEGALCRLVKELTSRHGDLSKDLQGKIDVVIEEFSLDKENSALSRLVQNVDRAQRVITSEFSLDNEQSALRRLKTELTTILEAHIKANGDFQREVTEALTKLVTRREEEKRSTRHGATFEAAVFDFVHCDCQRRGDVAEEAGARTGLIKNCKIGDVVITLGPDCAAAGARIVLEAKEETGYSLRKAQEEIEQARKNRDAQHGVFVFSRESAPKLEPLVRYGCDLFVVWDAEDPQTDVVLKAALEVARALCLRTHSAAERAADFVPIDRAVLEIEKRVKNLDQIRASAETIKSSSEKILDRVRIDREALECQVGILRNEMEQVKRALGEQACPGSPV